MPLPPPRPILGSCREVPSNPLLWLLKTTPRGYHRALAIQPETHRRAEADSFSHPGPRGSRAQRSILPISSHGRAGGRQWSGLLCAQGWAGHPESQLTVLPRVSWDRSFLVTQVWLL